ncbi:MAG TPA: AraC family transcriptional regulator, partial [Sphingomonas sp.]
ISLETISALRSDVSRLDRFAVFASRTPHEVRHHVATALCPHEMDVGARVMDAALHRAEIGGVQLMRLRYGAETAVRPNPLRDFVLLQFVLSGEVEIAEEGRRLQCGAGEAVIIETLEDRRLAWTADCEQLIVPVSRTALARAWEAMTGDIAPRAFGLQPSFRFEADDGYALVTLVRFLLIAATTPPGWTGQGPVADILAHHLLNSHACGTVGRRPAPRSGAIPYYVKRAERIMHDRPEDDITLTMLAEAARVSVRTLTGGFRDHRATSPLARLREIRLDRARRELLDNEAASVTDVALKLGFNHLGRFANVYRERFGEGPAATLTRTRQRRRLD